LAFFGENKLITSIDDDDVVGYRKARSAEFVIRHGKPSRKPISQTTINKELSTLRKLLRMARKKGIHDKVTSFPMEKEHSRNRTLSPEEYRKLLAACRPWLKRACVLAYETSLSRSDLLELTIDEVRLDERMIELRGGRNKSDVAQTIPIMTPGLL